MTMTPTLRRHRDRAGHNWRVPLALLALLVVVPAVASAATSYGARRFDVQAAVVENGDLDVTETVVFEFTSGTFTHVWRDIPTSRTDGIEIVGARMDGRPFTPGDGDGHITVSGRSRIRVEWHFAPTGPSAHTFELRYVARGVAYRDGGRDVIRWRLLPQEHQYAIADSRSTIAIARGTVDANIESHGVGFTEKASAAEGVQIQASNIRQNGWVLADLRFPAGTVVTAAPQWQQRRDYVASLAPRWWTGALAIFAAAVALLLFCRQGYSSPDVAATDTTTTAPPAPLPAALAAVLAGKGRAAGSQGVVTLLDLADRGVLEVHELARTFGVRNYELSQVKGAHELEDHEAEAVNIAFAGRAEPIGFSKARGRLARASRRFTASVNADLAKRGLLDADRKAVRDRLTATSIAMLLAGVIGCGVAAAFVPQFDGWPILLPLGLVIAALVGVVMAATVTSLSDEGLVAAAQWRGFKRHLKSLASARDAGALPAIDSRWIVYGIALGLAYQWSRFLKAHPGAAPSWFVASAHDDGAAFAAFVGSHAASAGGGAGAGGGAAGGGGSGAG
jgi:predicted membrane protein DUF2207